MVTYNLKYYYNSQPTITSTQEDLEVDYPYQLTFTLLTALTVNQRKNLKKIEITSGISDKHKQGYKQTVDLHPNYPFYKVKLSADKLTVSKGSIVKLTTTITNITTVSKVEYYLASTKIGETTSAPHTLNHLTDKVGTYLVTAKVTDSDNVVTVSNALTLTIN